jgi:hypothetical protein
MPDQTAPAIGLGFSIQNDGAFIGIHFDTPLSSFVVAFPVESARELVKQFPIQLQTVVDECDKTYGTNKNPLIIAKPGTMDILKKGHH